MPIQLNNLFADNHDISPSYFNQKLTGDGRKKSGALNYYSNPAGYLENLQTHWYDAKPKERWVHLQLGRPLYGQTDSIKLRPFYTPFDDVSSTYQLSRDVITGVKKAQRKKHPLLLKDQALFIDPVQPQKPLKQYQDKLLTLPILDKDEYVLNLDTSFDFNGATLYLQTYAKINLQQLELLSKRVTKGSENVVKKWPRTMVLPNASMHYVTIVSTSPINWDEVGSTYYLPLACEDQNVKVSAQSLAHHMQAFGLDTFAVQNCNHLNPLGLDLKCDIYAPVPANDLKFFATQNAELIADLPSDLTPIVNPSHIDQMIREFNTHDEVIKLAKKWQANVADLIIEHFDYSLSLVDQMLAAGALKDENERDLEIVKVIKNNKDLWDAHNLSLDDYKRIYDHFAQKLSKNAIAKINTFNAQFLMYNHLDRLNQIKDQLPLLPKPTNRPPAATFTYSNEQVKAICNNSPLTLIQSGAGTGKSTVVLGRIKYLIDSGVKPQDIAVISFTNAAADHIKDMNPEVNSSTIASLIHSIYKLNFPSHRLSTIDSLLNSLTIYKEQLGKSIPRSIILAFSKHLQRNKAQKAKELVKLNAFIEDNFSRVIEILNICKQTTLELEILITYQKVDVLEKPKECDIKYLIVDEVQDNSLFEFIFMLRFTYVAKLNLFMVGDCAQTLYEFRDADPTALNALEQSQIFTTFKLQNNYRSKQEILHYANEKLKTIEANRFANIQLRSYQLENPDTNSFKNCVNVCNFEVDNHNTYSRLDVLNTMFDSVDKLRGWFLNKLKKGQQVAFLAYSHLEVDAAKKALKAFNPNLNVVDITSKRRFNNTLITSFIIKMWDVIDFTSPATPGQGEVWLRNIQRMLNQHILANTQKHPSDREKYGEIIEQWVQDNIVSVNAWFADIQNGQAHFSELKQYLRESLIDLELTNNSIHNSIISNNQSAQDETNWSDADVVLSTIHSAKGLEFDNVILSYINNFNCSANQPDYRMFYVGLTRAKFNEFIIAFSDYESDVDVIDQHRQLSKTI